MRRLVRSAERSGAADDDLTHELISTATLAHDRVDVVRTRTKRTSP